jgi:hypothetical protein
MSYQRAVVNCRRCLSLGNKGFFNESYDSKIDRLRDEHLWEARNEAMKALEDIEGLPEKEKALSACMNCQYKKAEIAEIFDPSDGSV